LQTAKHEKVELVPVEWLHQQQTAHLLYDSTITKKGQKTLQEENDAQRLNVQFEPSGGWTDREMRCGTVDKNESKWTVLPHKSKCSSSSLGGYDSSTADAQVHAK